MMILPNVVNAVAVSTTINPVTHTALVDVNKASRKEIGWICALGSINNPEPIMMINKKLNTNSKAGGMFKELITPNNLSISVKIRITDIIIIGALPIKIELY